MPSWRTQLMIGRLFTVPLQMSQTPGTFATVTPVFAVFEPAGCSVGGIAQPHHQVHAKARVGTEPDVISRVVRVGIAVRRPAPAGLERSDLVERSRQAAVGNLRHGVMAAKHARVGRRLTVGPARTLHRLHDERRAVPRDGVAHEPRSPAVRDQDVGHSVAADLLSRVLVARGAGARHHSVAERAVAGAAGRTRLHPPPHPRRRDPQSHRPRPSPSPAEPA